MERESPTAFAAGVLLKGLSGALAARSWVIVARL
jgi:hypothetical protein